MTPDIDAPPGASRGPEPAVSTRSGSGATSADSGAIAATEELRSLLDVLRRVDAAAAAAQWGDDTAIAAVVDEAREELGTIAGTVDGDVAAAGASAPWRARAQDYAREVERTRDLSPTAQEAGANAVVAVGLAKAALAEAVLTVAQARGMARASADPAAGRRGAARRTGARLGLFGHRVAGELRHVAADKPRSILIRLIITLAISLSLVSFYHFSGMARYDDAGRLTLYLFSAVVGSVVCTNALCFEAERVRTALSRGDRLWRILVVKNLAMAILVTIAGLPVIAFLSVTDKANPVALIDQLVTMVFIWMGVGNVLSVVYPLRHEPVAARLRDGTWKPYLVSFAVSYGVGLTVNLMIFWRLFARQAAAAELAGGAWAAFALVLLSAIAIWVLLTVFAVACSREPRIRQVLSREMVVYRKPGG